MDEGTNRGSRGEPKTSTSSSRRSNVPPGGEQQREHTMLISTPPLLEQPTFFSTGVQHRCARECGRASASDRPREGGGGRRGHACPLQVDPNFGQFQFHDVLPLRIVGSNYGLFGVSEDSGKLELTATPDREQRDMYVLRVKVAVPFCLDSVIILFIAMLHSRKGKS